MYINIQFGNDKELIALLENDNVQIIGETEQIYLPLINGEYAVQVTENGCVDTSDCMLFTTASIPQGNLEKISCYPNPTLNDVTIQFGSIQGFVFVELYSVQGKILKEINFKGVDSMKIDLPNEAGVYLLHVLTENGWGAVRVLKE